MRRDGRRRGVGFSRDDSLMKLPSCGVMGGGRNAAVLFFPFVSGFVRRGAWVGTCIPSTDLVYYPSASAAYEMAGAVTHDKERQEETQQAVPRQGV